MNTLELKKEREHSILARWSSGPQQCGLLWLCQGGGKWLADLNLHGEAQAEHLGLGTCGREQLGIWSWSGWLPAESVLAGRWLLLSVKLCGLKCLFKVLCWGKVLPACQKLELCCARSVPRGLLGAAPELPALGTAGSRGLTSRPFPGRDTHASPAWEFLHSQQLPVSRSSVTLLRPDVLWVQSGGSDWAEIKESLALLLFSS